MARAAAARVQDRFQGESIRMGSTASVASALQENRRDSQRFMYGRIQTASQVAMRSWWTT